MSLEDVISEKISSVRVHVWIHPQDVSLRQAIHVLVNAPVRSPRCFDFVAMLAQPIDGVTNLIKYPG